MRYKVVYHVGESIDIHTKVKNALDRKSVV